jgi:hypothetical protein
MITKYLPEPSHLQPSLPAEQGRVDPDATPDEERGVVPPEL